MNNTYTLDRQDTIQYRGFQLIINDFRNLYLNKIVREVIVTPIQVPNDVALVFRRRIYERESFNRFPSVKEPKTLINTCYRVCQQSRIG